MNNKKYSLFYAIAIALIGGLPITGAAEMVDKMPKDFATFAMSLETYVPTLVLFLVNTITFYVKNHKPTGTAFWMLLLIPAVMLGGCATTYTKVDQTLENGESFVYVNKDTTPPFAKKSETAGALEMEVMADGGYKIKANQAARGIDNTNQVNAVNSVMTPLAPLFNGAGAALGRINAPQPVEPEPELPPVRLVPIR